MGHVRTPDAAAVLVVATLAGCTHSLDQQTAVNTGLGVLGIALLGSLVFLALSATLAVLFRWGFRRRFRQERRRRDRELEERRPGAAAGRGGRR